MDIGLPDRHIQLYAADTGAVLSTVVLLFHQQEELVHPPKAGAVAVVIIGEWLAQANCGNAAFVVEGIAQLAGGFSILYPGRR